MGAGTPIQWCDDTVNPVSGCSGCELWLPEQGIRKCYAGTYTEAKAGKAGFRDRFTQKFLEPKLFPGRIARAAKASDLSGKARAKKPWIEGARRLIFVSDMGDALSPKDAMDSDDRPLGEGVPFKYLYEEIVLSGALSEKGQRHIWLWLTKYPARMAEFSRWLAQEKSTEWPPNLWPGTSVTSPATLNRVQRITEIGAREQTRFLSIEPLWGDVAVDLEPALRSNEASNWWFIIGGESKQGQDEVSEFRLEWASGLISLAQSVGAALFLKQIGARATLNGVHHRTRDSHGGDWSEWPAHLRVRQIPNSAYPPRTTNRAPRSRRKQD
ncbi:MAG: DUF5131 family protein [Planctomycetota bacterium]